MSHECETPNKSGCAFIGNMDTLLKEKIDGILQMGEGVKALLFDEETKGMMSNIIPHSRFLENDYFLFDSIMNRKRERIQGITCMAVIRPESIKWLVEEVSDPYYERYIVLFTNQIDSLMLEVLATSDIHCVVSEVHEIYIDFFRQDEFLYTLFRRGSESYEGRQCRRRAVDGLFAFVMNMKKIPTVLVQNGCRGLFEDAEQLTEKLSGYNYEHGGTVIILDRGFDMYTPLVYEWRYQSLLHDHVKYEDGVAKVGKKAYLVAEDDFFNECKFKDINEVSEMIKGLVKRAEVKKRRLQSLIFDDLEENTRISRQIEAHLALHAYILKASLRLKEPSEMEMDILRGKAIDKNEIANYLLRTDVSSVERSKLLAIYALKNGKDLQKEAKNYPDLVDGIECFLKKYPPSMQAFMPYSYRFDDDVDAKLGYQPAVKRLVRHWWADRLNDRYLSVVRSTENPKDFIVVYVRNGVTYSEYRALYEFYKSKVSDHSKVYVIGDFMVSYKDMFI
ncbi:sec1 protein [Ordospora pajunii]|uniref:sec1 protein n=1 Tax=Ordospora pajunii TaxID=3039483 RepID=UPI0029528702|nr:sec1 protein [Ordospora pajunii]KAH9411184.1 sec1 protein [Ordospora pajunii]